MDFETWKERFEDSWNELEDLIHVLPQKGDKAETCQRMHLQQQLNELWYALNGTEAEDLIEDKED